MLSSGPPYRSTAFWSTGNSNGYHSNSGHSNGGSSTVVRSSKDGPYSDVNIKSMPISKPPLPPRPLAPSRARIINARNEFFSGQDVQDSNRTPMMRGDNVAKKDTPAFEILAEKFRQRAKEGRERVARTVLDLNEIERAFTQQQQHGQMSTTLPKCNKNNVPSPPSREVKQPVMRFDSSRAEGQRVISSVGKDNADRHNSLNEHGESTKKDKNLEFLESSEYTMEDDNCTSQSSMLSSPATVSNGSCWNDRRYLETDIDTLHSREVIIQEPESYRPFQNSNRSSMKKLKTRSMVNLTSELKMVPKADTLDYSDDPRAKSMEFLLDNDENLAALLPPENQLMAAATFHNGSNTRVSEHELRFRRSLQKLNLPDWYVNSPLAQMGNQKGFRLRDHDRSQATPPTKKRWQDVKYNGSSATSPQTPNNGKNVIIAKRVTSPDWRQVKSSRESQLQSPVSPKSSSRNYFQYSPTMARWNSSYHFGTMTSARSSSPTGSLYQQNHSMSPTQRRPYMGWRSSEHIGTSTPTPGTTDGYFYRTAAERLSRGPGYYSMRFGSLCRSPSGDTGPAYDTGTATILPKTDTDMMKPNSCYENSESSHLEVAELVRKIDSLIHKNGETGENDDSEERRYSSDEEEGVSPESKSQQKPLWLESSFVGVKRAPLLSPKPESALLV